MFDSPLRYPGGKAKIASLVQSVFEENDLIGGCYVEPYAGGASVGLSLLYNGFVSKIIINDYDRSIYAFWYAVIHDTDNLCRLIRDTSVNMSTWKKQQAVQKQKETAGLLDLAFSTFFLNRTNRSGIIKAGVIGGNDQSGNYKMDARFNKAELINRIQKVSFFSEGIELYNLDAIRLITQVTSELPQRTLIYFDPPYYVKGKDLYVNYYKHGDHFLVSQMIRGIREHKWIVSYDNNPEIKKLYRGNKQFTYSLKYSAVNATSGTEVIIHNTDLYIPHAARPPLTPLPSLA